MKINVDKEKQLIFFMFEKKDGVFANVELKPGDKYFGDAVQFIMPFDLLVKASDKVIYGEDE